MTVNCRKYWFSFCRPPVSLALVLCIAMISLATGYRAQGPQASQSVHATVLESTGSGHLELNHARAAVHSDQSHERSKTAVIPPEILNLFEYPRSLPVNVQELSAEQRKEATVHDIMYAGPLKGRVTAYLVVPTGRGPFAGVVFQHWGFGDRTEFLPEMLSLARAGAVSISIDAPWARPEPWKTEDEGGHITHPEVDRDIYVQTVVDLRRAVDILLSRNEVDPKRIGFVGHSYGATWGGVLAGVEKRIRTYVLTAGLPDVADFTPGGARSMDSISEQVKAKFAPQEVQHYVDTISAIAPARFIKHSSPASILMQFALKDTFVSQNAASRYFEAAGNPKQQRWYFASHELNDPAALQERDQWLRKELRLSCSSAEHPGRVRVN